MKKKKRTMMKIRRSVILQPGKQTLYIADECMEYVTFHSLGDQIYTRSAGRSFYSVSVTAELTEFVLRVFEEY
eukprot:scaffold6043_cov19-Prasinocladus_malaysianus.AAC.1